MKKKLLSLFVTCCLILSFLSLPMLEGRADEKQFGAIYVGDVEMDSSNGTVYATTDATGTVTIQETYKENDPWNVKYSGNTLVLRNATIKGTGSNSNSMGAGLYYFPASENDTVQIELIGDNVINGFDDSDGTAVISSAMVFPASVTITGSGNLIVTAGKSSVNYGCYCSSITINCSGKVSFSGGESMESGYGLYGEEFVRVVSGKVYADGGKVKNEDEIDNSDGKAGKSFGIISSSLEVKGGKLTAVGGTIELKAQEIVSAGVYSQKTNIHGGTVTAIGGNVPLNGISRSFFVDGESVSVVLFPFSGSSIAAKAGNSKDAVQPLNNSPFREETDITKQITDTVYFHSNVNVTEVIVTPSATSVQKGQSKQFEAKVLGEGDVDVSVTWSVIGASSTDTTISDGGLLKVSAQETAKSLTVRAISNSDTTKSGTAVVTVTEPSNGGTDTSNPSSNSANTTSHQSGIVLKDTATKNTYKVTGNGTVEYLGNTAKKKKTVEIPNTVVSNGVRYTVTSIANNAFKNNKKLTKVVIGKNVTKIGKNAFYGCKNLKKITIKSTKLKKKSIGAKAFTKAGKKNYSKLKVIVPKQYLNTYKKLLRQKGLSVKAIVKK